MNNQSRAVTSLVYFLSLIRDTLEYTQLSNEYKIEAYNYKKAGIKNEPHINSPLGAFIKNNGENGKKLLKKIDDFAEKYYSDKGILNVEDNKLVVDNKRIIEIFQDTIPLVEEIDQVVKVHANSFLKDNYLDWRVEDLCKESQRYLRCIEIFTIGKYMVYLFSKFNTEMKESNGQVNDEIKADATSLNILNDFIFYIKKNATCNDLIYTDALDNLMFMSDVMGGKRVVKEGSKMEDYIKASSEANETFLKDANEKYQALYNELINELIADTSKDKEAKN